MYPKDLEGRATPLDPNWALRAQALYMRRLDNTFRTSDKWETRAFALAAYNGGSGHIVKEKVMAKEAGFDPMRWFLHVERFCKRAQWACEENRAYPRKILFRWTPVYQKAGW
jgi:membrane-bound lytic murein transglycosylase MltF